MLKFLLLSFFLIGFSFTLTSYAETISKTMDASMDLEIIYPDTVIIDRIFPVSIFLKNNGWEDKQDIEIYFDNPSNVMSTSKNHLIIKYLSSEGSFGDTIDFMVSENASQGTHYLNVEYSQVLLSNNIEPMESFKSSFTIPINVIYTPTVLLQTVGPESIFPNTEFQFEVTIISENIDLTNVSLKIIPTDELILLGETSHSFSSIKKGMAKSIYSELKIQQEHISSEHTIPVTVLLTYTDDLGIEHTDSKSHPIILRPRTQMELTSDGGIWIGDFFIAPYVSLGTIIGIPAGTIFSLIIKRALSKKKNSKK